MVICGVLETGKQAKRIILDIKLISFKLESWILKVKDAFSQLSTFLFDTVLEKHLTALTAVCADVYLTTARD